MLDDFFSKISGRIESHIGRVVIKFLRCILALRAASVLCSLYNFINRSALKKYLC